MELDELEEVAATIELLLNEELGIQHRLGGHELPAEGCPVCRSRAG